MDHRRIVAAAAGLLLLTSGCGAGPEEEAGQAAAPAPSTSRSYSLTPTPAPTQDAYEGVEPADGPLLEFVDVRMRAPKGFEVLEVPFQGTAASRKLRPRSPLFVYISLRQIPGVTTMSLAELAEESRVGLPGDKPMKVMPAVTLGNGTKFYHLRGYHSTGLQWNAEFGAPYRGDLVRIGFSFPEEVPMSEREATIRSVLATFEFT